MRNMINNIGLTGTFTAIATGLSALLGGYDETLYILLVCVVLDFITGIAKSIKQRSLSSGIGVDGVIRKLMFLVVVMVANLVDMALDMSLWRDVVCYALVFNEFLSISENLALLGVPIPKALLNLLKQVQEQLDNGELPEKGSDSNE